MSLHCIWVSEIDHTMDKRTRHVWHSNSCLAWHISLGQNKTPYHKRKYLIAQEIKYFFNKDLMQERQKVQGCGVENMCAETLVLT